MNHAWTLKLNKIEPLTKTWRKVQNKFKYWFNTQNELIELMFKHVNKMFNIVQSKIKLQIEPKVGANWITKKCESYRWIFSSIIV